MFLRSWGCSQLFDRVSFYATVVVNPKPPQTGVTETLLLFCLIFFYVLFPIPGLQRYPALNYSPMHPVNHPNSLKTCFLVQEQTLSSWAHTIHFVSALLVKNKTKNKHSQVYLISPLTSHLFFFFFLICSFPVFPLGVPSTLTCPQLIFQPAAYSDLTASISITVSLIMLLLSSILSLWLSLDWNINNISLLTSNRQPFKLLLL